MTGIATPDSQPMQPNGEDEQASGLATAQLMQQMQEFSADVPQLTSNGHAPEEDDISSYMADLLARHNPNGEVAPQPAPQDPVAVEDVAASEEPAQPRLPVAPPERRDDLALMRELANSNAKSALDAYSSTRMVKTTQGRLQIAALSVLMSVLLAFFSSSVTSLAFIGSIVCLTVAVLWTSRYLLLVRHLKSLMNHPAQLATAQPDAVPMMQAEAASLAPQSMIQALEAQSFSPHQPV